MIARIVWTILRYPVGAEVGFTDEFITFPDGSMAQVLKAEKGAETLAEENGKPWAIRNGNLVIASRLPEKMPEKDATSLLQYLKMVLQK